MYRLQAMDGQFVDNPSNMHYKSFSLDFAINEEVYNSVIAWL